MRARRVLSGLAAVLVALVGVVALLLFLQSRDRSTIGDRPAKGPGKEYPDQGNKIARPAAAFGFHYNSDPPTSGPHARAPLTRYDVNPTTNQALTAMSKGSVVLYVNSPAEDHRALGLARAYDAPSLRGADFSALAGAGQAVIVAYEPTGLFPRGTGVIAASWRHLLHARSADDPSVKQFIDFRLGRGTR